MKTKLILLASLSALTLPVFAAKKMTTKIYNNPEKPIYVTKKSATVTIKLQSNATTGYSWFLQGYDHKLVKPVSAKYIPPKVMLAGAPGYMLWTFKLKKDAFLVPQVTKVELVYARPWDMKDDADKDIVFVTK